jgi:glucose/mannose-6-phosphate isomerase
MTRTGTAGTGSLLELDGRDPRVPYGALDSEAMLEAAAGLPEQLADAAAAARTVVGDGSVSLPAPAEVGHVAVLGMGGSGVAGEVLAAFGRARMPVPLTLSSSYELPASVGPGTLLFAVSFSGNTEETLAAAEQAAGDGAALVAVTRGGSLGELARRAGGSVFALPEGISQPRAGVGVMTAPLLVACEHLGLLPGAGAEIEAAVAQLERRRDELLVADGGLAGELARRIGRTIPLVYGATPYGSVAARRWKTQVNENAKAPAFFAAEPELCHNEVCGWGQNGDVTRQTVTLVDLRTDHEHPQVARRFAIVDEIVREVVAGILSVRAGGDGELAQLFDLMMVGDFVSLHLAYREGIDPGPVPVLDEIKTALRSG